MHLFEDFRAIVRVDEPLAPLTWFRLGGPAAFLARPTTVEDLAGLIRTAQNGGVAYKILSGGSNVLVRDEGFPGLVIHLESPVFSDVKVTGNRVESGSAVPLTALISQTARAGLGGLEVLTGIPGTVGGALKGNSGGRQGAIGNFTRRVSVLDNAGEIQIRERDELQFGYRSSNLMDPVILSAEFELVSEPAENVVRRMRRIWIIKKENQPYGHQSSGCIFKNPVPDISAGLLIEQAGLKGFRVGGAEVCDRHANYIIAQPGATSSDVLSLIDEIRERISTDFNYELELQIDVW
jgi:UDP-N-acetylmuramate dehydrogenase